MIREFFRSYGSLAEWVGGIIGAFALFALVPMLLFLALGMGWSQ